MLSVQALLSVSNRADRVSLCRRAALSVLVLFCDALPPELCIIIAQLVFASREDVAWGRLRFPVACGPHWPVIEISRLFGPGFGVYSVGTAAWVDDDESLVAAGVEEGDELLVQPRYVRLVLRWGGNWTEARFDTSATVAAVQQEVRRISGRECFLVMEVEQETERTLHKRYPLALLDDMALLECMMLPRRRDVFS